MTKFLNAIILGPDAPNADGELSYDATRKLLRMFDSVRERNVMNAGFMPYAYPIGMSPSDVTTTALALAANGGSLAVPVVLDADMLLQSVSFWNTDAATARGGAEFRLYEDRLNNANSLNEIAGANGTLASWTPVAASIRTITPAAPVYLAPGVYWLVLRNQSAAQTLGVGVAAAGTMARNTAQTKTLGSVLGSTLDLVAVTWTKITTVPGIRLDGRVFGQSSAF
jgi:hypothetical protein